ncbi:MAG: hypothetical protein LBE92_15770 [Chryseobacterium sp.]|jgi:hypothetical protein|uniref:hypothetical protein n=1 Tax=Chryseobacterium sp. TaxID=1871047 RepID=UPI00282B6422|nr:hypothetical protein [Chryseobacterium sp.]MDR2237579.1 hypothetical protein [Chryseobacterium sp.]
MKFNFKSIFPIQLTALLFLLVSCGSDEDSLQRIDQIMNIYVRNEAGQDLLNAKKAGSFTGYSVNDREGDKDVAPVSISLKMTTDSLFYFDYTTGAKRKILDSISPDNKTYRSRMTFTYSKKVNDQTVTESDEMEIHYRWTPNLFQVSEVFYNGVPVFSKSADQPNSINTVTIVK